MAVAFSAKLNLHSSRPILRPRRTGPRSKSTWDLHDLFELSDQHR
jgi:hypothetical protein